jgi:spore coat polysaccharide biosynthesis protein SpsF (cytidylyltransferase family)
MGATRLPGKVMMQLAGKPVLWHVFDRLSRSKTLAESALATTDNPADDILASSAEEWGYRVYRGSEDDVLDRYYQAATVFEADPVVRITADCPLIDPEIVDRTVERFLKEEGCALMATSGHYPDGVDTAVFARWALDKAWKEATLPSEREHVGPYILNHKEFFRTLEMPCEADYSGLRWTLDEQRDYEFLTEVMNRLYKEGGIFHMDDVLRLLAREPGLMKINSGIVRNEGYLKSLKADAEQMRRGRPGS